MPFGLELDASPPPRPLPQPPMSPGGPEEMESQEPETRLEAEEEEASSPWGGPDELELVLQDGQTCVQARCSLAEGLSWGPFCGSIQTRASSPRQAELSPALTLLLEDEACWLKKLPHALTEAKANSEIHRKGEALWCRVTKPVPAGGHLCVRLTAEPHGAPSHPVKKEPMEPEGPAPSHTDIQLLPQQAGMASILATAVVNKDVFPCKDCGIWYRSERNLQAHLLYYCASRQGSGSPATAAPDEKPKETYPNERICPFPQCRKSCPSASSLEIHMRSHSGERPFVCLICLSAFTTKANCERHLKVHTDTLTGVCHSCGFISTTRDILYSHLVTNHMVCQPGSKAEIYSPGAGHPTAKLPPDSLAGFQQHTALHGPLASADLGLATAPSPGLDRKALAEATNGEARAAPQNGSSGEPPAAPRSIKVEAAEEPEAEPGPPAPSRTPSPPSPSPVRVKAELSSPTPGSSPGPGALFLPQLPAAPPASEILAKMSELVHSRLQAGAGVGAPAGLFAGAPKGATCFECDITFNNINNFYVHKRLYCSGPPPADDGPPPAGQGGPPPRRARPQPRACEPTHRARRRAPGREGRGPGARVTPEAEAEAAAGAARAAQPGSGADEDDDPAGRCPIDLSKEAAAPDVGPAATRPHAGLPALADYHECTGLPRELPQPLRPNMAHKKFSVVRGDLIEHLPLAHGLLLGSPRTAPARARTPSPPRARDGLNGQDLREPPASSPRPGPPRPRPLQAVPAPPSHSDKGVQTPSQGSAAPVPNGNHRYCRLCNIKFSSLSTFIAHKKYYCSSHAAEHVK
ncbi:Zinc finger protein ZFPM1 [Camelus dromedarius]|uniref:Zinc finger protein ZFPM1 n=1 Tax=Camelus dromedarius TaxID=9838 RepID=A0A5N4CNY8_CAMDR|nr:Zinc finger protein ZFPM1 [Camelus dromedarius]